LLLWSERDPVFDPRLFEDSLEYCTDGRMASQAKGGHWLHHEYSDWVNRMLLEFLEG
jgi:hypothetical protein